MRDPTCIGGGKKTIPTFGKGMGKKGGGEGVVKRGKKKEST